ncbi:hypothetical protein HY414_02165 [Candidatus Kaiserbacteria bacterium]|nr:hypothetical protein [Candidatus Kaiserbacteria bacterium]
MELEHMASMHESSDQQKGLTLAEASLFAGKALREMRREDIRARCIDGRYPEGAAAIAMPGGDAGLLAAGLGLAHRFKGKGIEISNEAVRNAVFKVIGGKERFNYHTDEHTVEHGGSAFNGCGHCSLLAGDPTSYFLDSDQVDFFRKTIEELNAEGVEPDVLNGKHEERAVMVVRAINNESGKVWALDGQADLDSRKAQAFVYQSDLAEQRFTALAKALAETSSEAKAHENEIEDTLKKIAQIQLQRTKEALAKDLPLYTVTVDGETGKFSVE